RCASHPAQDTTRAPAGAPAARTVVSPPAVAGARRSLWKRSWPIADHHPAPTKAGPSRASAEWAGSSTTASLAGRNAASAIPLPIAARWAPAPTAWTTAALASEGAQSSAVDGYARNSGSPERAGSPSGNGHTPSGNGHTPSGNGHTPSGNGHTPSGN